MIVSMEALGLNDALGNIGSTLLRTPTVNQPTLLDLLASAGLKIGAQSKVFNALTNPGFLQVPSCFAVLTLLIDLLWE